MSRIATTLATVGMAAGLAFAAAGPAAAAPMGGHGHGGDKYSHNYSSKYSSDDVFVACNKSQEANGLLALNLGLDLLTSCNAINTGNR